MNHDHQYRFFLHNELNELYIVHAIRSFALGMIGIFVALYLLELGYSLSEVFFFHAGIYGFHILATFLAAWFCSKKGFKHSMFISTFPVILLLWMLYTLDTYSWSLIILAIVAGFSRAFFWMGYHCDFAFFSHKKTRGKELSTASIVGSIANVLGPLSGGVLIVMFSFKIVFIIVSVLLAISVIPLFMTKDVHQPFNFSARQILKGQKWKTFTGFIASGMETQISIIIWPIFIFTILGSYATLGIVWSVKLLFSLISFIFVGRLYDSYHRIIYKIGAFINAIVWILRMFVQTIGQVFAVDILYGATRPLLIIPFSAISYSKANRAGVLRFTVFREVSINLGSLLLFTFLGFIAVPLQTTFVFGTGLSFLYLLF